ncbi:hypothetical protein BDZ89DRAFT_1098328 [Hymenopellis radicata]|nr:hypothetical protein BDZ89DRAFT_1098328 [Hymenopellis radicata]
MLTHRGFSAWIVANGKPLPEYLVAVDAAAHRISCWIPSERNQAFAVYWQDHDGKVDTCSFITLDGHVVPGRFLYGTGFTFRSGVRTSKNTERPFTFQQITEQATTSSPERKSTDTGMITLRIKRIKRISSRNANPIQDPPSPPAASQSGEIRIGYGQDIKTFEQSHFTWLLKPYDPTPGNSKKPSTYVSFVFRYRSRDFLIAQGIMPESHRQTSITRSPPEKRRTASAPVTPVLTVPPKIPVTSVGSPPAARLGGTRSLPSTMYRPQPRRLVTMPPQILEQTTKTSLYSDSLKPFATPTRRVVSMKSMPYPTSGQRNDGVIYINKVESTSPDVEDEDDEEDDYFDDSPYTPHDS